MGAGQRAAGRQAHSSSTCGEGESVTWRVPRAACEGGGSRTRWWWMNEGGDAGDDGAGGGGDGGGGSGSRQNTGVRITGILERGEPTVGVTCRDDRCRHDFVREKFEMISSHRKALTIR